MAVPSFDLEWECKGLFYPTGADSVHRTITRQL